jgi:multidrug efflux pump subunit AcrB
MTRHECNPEERSLGFAGRIARAFIDSKLTPLLIIAALLLGAVSIVETPREEEPQIVVPILDSSVGMPGASADEVAQRVSEPMERLLQDIPGVEYVYSISHPGMSLLIVRFTLARTGRRGCSRLQQALFQSLTTFPQEFRSRLSRNARLMTCESWH